MPIISKTFEFVNPWSTTNTHTSQASITMPQMVKGRKPPPSLTLYSNPIHGPEYFKLVDRDQTVIYTVSGAFKGQCVVQASLSPKPTNSDWTDLSDLTKHIFTGTETTGAAGITGGFSGKASRPTFSVVKEFSGNFSWLRIRIDISRGTLQQIRYNF
jgi:hypothetical protein